MAKDNWVKFTNDGKATIDIEELKRELDRRRKTSENQEREENE